MSAEHSDLGIQPNRRFQNVRSALTAVSAAPNSAANTAGDLLFWGQLLSLKVTDPD
ncbi:hypothetical protein [Cognatishimia sp.]|uniref:hypothetical protein n=1 Tax=Cognatishimia sp. TaxID=2211648 RepID=UPI003513359C|nr:hypothetical protein [Cognatishimia sp.]